MDLNLYLGPPRSPMRRGSDLGSDLTLGSISMLAEEVRSSAEVSVFNQPLDSHTPYSPTHASYTPNRDPIDPLDHQQLESPHVEYSSYNPQVSYRSVPPLSGDGTSETSRMGYCQYAPTYVSAFLPTQQGTAEPSHPDSNQPFRHTPYSPTYTPLSTIGRHSSEPLGGRSEDIEYVPSSPSYSPLPVSENFDPYAPSSSAYAPVSTSRHDRSEPIVEVGNRNANLLSSPSYSPGSMPAIEPPNEGLVPEEADPYVPPSPPYVPFVQTTQTQVHGERSLGENSHPEGVLSQSSSIFQIGDTILDGSSQQRLLNSPEFRIRRLIDSNRRRRNGRFRLAGPIRVNGDLHASSPGMEDHNIPEMTALEAPVEVSGSLKAKADESLAANGTEEEVKDEGNAAANFECNICLEMAREPVVTSCGHLFCWPCLYQWLHLHSDHKECPVCKGEVTESNVTPIYGRGSSGSTCDRTGGKEGGSSLKIPPRPRGHRFESWRQQMRRPFSRRLGHEISTWRRIADDEMSNGNQVEGSDLQGILDGASRRVFSRLRAAQRLRREGSAENRLNMGSSGPSGNAADIASNSENGGSQNDGLHGGPGSSSLYEGIDFLHRLALFGLPSAERFAVLTAGFSSVVERMTSNGSNVSATTPSNPTNTEPSQDHGGRGATPGVEQASASSTMAMIHGDVGAMGTSTDANVAGSSRSLRRRRRNGASSSLDVDGGINHAFKRRRLN